MLLEKIIHQARQRPNDIAVVDDQRSISFRQLMMASQMMAGFVDQAMPGTDRVGLLIPQSAGFAVAFLGSRWTGRMVVPLNYLFKVDELLPIARAAELKYVITIRYFKALAQGLEQAGVRVLFIEDMRFGALWPRMKAWARRRRLPERRPDEVAAILYTSGTSAVPKGVMLTNSNLDSNAADAIEHARFNDQMTFLGVLPMFHTLGLMACFLVPLSLGCKVVYQARFNPAAVLEAIKKHHVEVLIAVPTMYALLANCKSATRDGLSSVRYAISGGEPLPLALVEKFRDQFGIPLLEGFGLTETSPIVTLSTPWACKPGCVGRPIPHQQLRIVNENGENLPVNQDGELWIKGPNVMRGYYHDPEATAAVLTPDGWFKTGDIARIDADGFLAITGRKKEMIIMAGEKIAPGEIEDIIRKHPAVLLVAVIGAKDPQRGEVPVAFVQLEPGLAQRPTAQEIRVFVRSRLAPYKTPRDVYFVDDMPRSPTGKILKRALVIPATGPVNQAVTE